ncbi:MAG: hypothetical protein ABSG65_22240 [Bryobacteraceae bacterium]|jgi:hypothetical protein
MGSRSVDYRLPISPVTAIDFQAKIGEIVREHFVLFLDLPAELGSDARNATWVIGNPRCWDQRLSQFGTGPLVSSCWSRSSPFCIIIVPSRNSNDAGDLVINVPISYRRQSIRRLEFRRWG